MPKLNSSKASFLLIFALIISLSPRIGAQVTYEEAFPNLNFQYPVEIQNANDGSDRLFVVEQPGRIRVFPNNSSATPGEVNVFLDLTSQVSFSSGQEIGLLGLAFHPNFTTNGYFYVYYTAQSSVSGINVEIVLSRFRVSTTNPNLADPGSELILFSFDKNQLDSNHNGGKIGFGPDGYLYISVGDGGNAGDPRKNAQNLDNIFGSILRIDVDVDGSNPVESNPDLPNGNYEIPSDNPRVSQSGLDEIYAWGIRNTWKFSFDNPTGRLWGADVGQGDFEEINLISNGGNYGWDRFEGNSLEDTSTSLVTTPDIKPVFEYDHNNGDVSITGGYVYRGASTDPAIQGKYIFADYVSGRVWALDYNEGTGSASSELLFQTSGQFVSSFGLDEAGELYFSNYGNSVKLYKIIGGTGSGTNTPVNGVGQWYPIENGTNGVVDAVAFTADDQLIIGGEFSTAGTVSASNLAQYSPLEGWRPFGTGTNGRVSAIAVAGNGHIYVGGSFTQIGGVAANNIAYWDGASWNSLGSGTAGPVAKIGIDSSDNVYVGGVFVTAGGITVNNIALWSGSSWSALTDIGNGISGTNNEIRAIAFDENDVLYVGGNFDSAGGNSAPRIATWNGSNWGTLGTGTSGFVQAISIDAGFVYAGGNFAEASGATVNRIARWNRNILAWEPLGVGLSGNVRAMIQNDGFLYVGGSFETATDVVGTNKIVNYMARWSQGAGWEALGTNTNVGVSNQINGLVFSNDQLTLFAGGNFSTAGLANANNIARWTEVRCADIPLTIEYQIDGGSWVPAGSEIQVFIGQNLSLSTVESDSNFIVTLPNATEVNGNYTLSNITEAAEGNYIFTLPNGCFEIVSVIVNPIPDDDNDGVNNSLDLCPDTPNGETVDSNGCSQSQLDDDNDGVNNTLDQCPNTPTAESVDANGCSQSQLDGDNDGVNNALDQCPNTPAGESVDSEGCAQSQLDDDNDGVTNDLDQCPNTPAGASVNAEGCAQSQLDDDNDGVNNAIDQCPATPSGATVDQYGCEAGQTDGDNDGVTNALDLCPNTPNGESVDSNGCSQSQLDDDQDGVSNALDQCPGTQSGLSVDANGCAQNQLDDDNDGVFNDIDQCSNTPSGEEVNTNGCSPSQLDDDNDGVSNDLDQCPNTPSNTPVDIDGCPESSLPSDNFAIAISSNTCPNTANGAINIVATQAFTYSVQVNSTGYSQTFNFNDQLTISDLSAGFYEICITADEIPGYEYCATAVITEPDELQVDSSINFIDETVTLRLKGALNYTIEVNSEVLKTSAQQITVPLKAKTNKIRISTDLECQGIYEEIILLPEEVIIYPNPFDNSLTFSLKNRSLNEAEVELFSESGQIIKKMRIEVVNSQTSLNTEFLSSGIYFVRISTGSFSETFKIIKR